MSEPRVAFALLGAGLSHRYGSEKLLADLHGKRLLQWSLDNFAPLPSKKFLVVREDFPLERFDLKGFETVVNPDCESGIATSVKVVLESCEDSFDGLVLALADMPCIDWRDVERLVSASKEGRVITAFTHSGLKGFPTHVPRTLFGELLTLEGDEGAFSLVKSGRASFKSIVGELRHTLDVDVPADRERAEKLLESECRF